MGSTRGRPINPASSSWVDRERNGWITIWVKGADVDALQREVAQRWPGKGIVVVEVPWTTAELEALRTEVRAALREAGVRTGGSALLPHHGVAEIGLGVITPEAEEVLADFAGQPLCVDGIRAEQAPEEKEQPTAGEGWRLLGEGLTGESYRTAVATTGDQMQQMWRTAGYYTCLSFNFYANCESARIRLDAADLTTSTSRRNTACHEIGHSGGLRHGGTVDCMQTSSGSYTTYSSHHIYHLNNRN